MKKGQGQWGDPEMPDPENAENVENAISSVQTPESLM